MRRSSVKSRRSYSIASLDALAEAKGWKGDALNNLPTILDAIIDDSASMVVSLYPSTSLAGGTVRNLAYDSRPALNYPTAWLDQGRVPCRVW